MDSEHARIKEKNEILRGPHISFRLFSKILEVFFVLMFYYEKGVNCADTLVCRAHLTPPLKSRKKALKNLLGKEFCFCLHAPCRMAKPYKYKIFRTYTGQDHLNLTKKFYALRLSKNGNTVKSISQQRPLVSLLCCFTIFSRPKVHAGKCPTAISLFFRAAFSLFRCKLRYFFLENTFG